MQATQNFCLNWLQKFPTKGLVTKEMTADFINRELPMFDKNFFKDAFRSWVLSNSTASEEEALAFCQSHIPAHVFASNYWLVEQSLQWFIWMKTQAQFDAVELHEEDEAWEDSDPATTGRLVS